MVWDESIDFSCGFLTSFLNRGFKVVYTGHAISGFIEEHSFQVQGMIYYSSWNILYNNNVMMMIVVLVLVVVTMISWLDTETCFTGLTDIKLCKYYSIL